MLSYAELDSTIKQNAFYFLSVFSVYPRFLTVILWADILSTSYMSSTVPRNKYTLFHVTLTKRIYDLPLLSSLYRWWGLRLKKVKWLMQGHTASEMWSWVSIQCDSEAQAYHHFVTPPTHNILDFVPKTVDLIGCSLLENSGWGKEDQ